MMVLAVVEVRDRPITEAVEPVPVPNAPVLKFLIVFPEIVFIPDELTIPRTIEAVFAAAGT